MKELFEATREASIQLALLDTETINQVLNDVADAAIAHTEEILAANAKDLARMDEKNPMYDRLKLTRERIEGIAADTRNVATLPSPLGRVLKHVVLPNGLDLKRVSVPFGVIGIVYEARPNVTFDVFSLCLKSGNACLLKGGKDADDSNRCIVSLIKEVLKQHQIDENVINLLPATHEATAQLLHANGWVDMVIPRGSKRLIDFVRKEASVPVIETGAGVCHAYFDKDGDLEKGIRIINNAKTRRVSVCNALDCTLVHIDRLNELPQLLAPLQESNVRIYADEVSFAVLEAGGYSQSLLHHAKEEDYGTEFQDYAMALRIVDNMDEALLHIRRHGSGHSECIITENEKAISRFFAMVDAEIGISTQKLHARGPMALEEITTYKWVIRGNGQTRPR